MKNFSTCALVAGLMVAVGCNTSTQEKVVVKAETKVLYDFETAGVSSNVVAEAVSFELVSGEGVTSGNQALKVVYPTASLYKKVAFEPATPWDLSGMSNCCLAVDVTNVGDDSVQYFLTMKDKDQSVTAHANVGAGESVTMYYDLSNPNTELDLGMTGWPGRLAAEVGQGRKVIPCSYAWGARVLDLSTLNYIGLYMKGNLTERTVVLDHVRIVSNPNGDVAKLDGLIDAYGQYSGMDWQGKVKSDKDLKKQAKREAKLLKGETGFSDRSKYGGWLNGPQLEATGYFRTEKVNGKWAMVDPEGYLFFATGIANCRLVNTPTVTGMDYEDVSARTDAFVADETRRSLFSWLPDEGEPLADHYGYVGSVHTGPLKKGQTYCFYAANLHRKYGEDYLNLWKEVTLERMRHWGFTCFGNWTDAQFYKNDRVAYFAHAWISGAHKRVSTGNDYWAPMHDPFDYEFAASVERSMKQLYEKVQGDPWCIGVFVDNELSWGDEGTDAKQYGIVMNTLGRDAAESPAKAAFVNLLKQQYGTIQKLNAAWGTQVASWDVFATSFKHEGDLKDQRRADFAMLSEALAAEYFSVVNRELKKLMPNHLYMGCRFADWGMTPEAVKAAAKHTDVISYNLYTEGLPGHLGDWLDEVDRPSVLGEFHFGAIDRGMFHGGICTASDQTDRGVKYATYMKSVIANSNFVGAHWFQYIDSPTSGRTIDGENYNSGFVSVTDQPYEELVHAAQDVNRQLYELRFGAAVK